ncbi:MAG: NAD(P)-dependent alcohol dehydrogenase [Caulobacteraceae bacterium]
MANHNQKRGGETAMKVYEVLKGGQSMDALRQGERPDPEPGPGQVLIRVRACSMNYRDLAVVRGVYLGGPVQRDTIPLSDGAGEVAAVGAGVTRFKVGDRVAGTFFQGWIDGAPPLTRAALGSPLDGMLAEYVALSEDGVVAIPPSISFEDAAAIPCAGVTAWNALMLTGRPLRPGDTVLCLGTGGVSIWALQIAKAAGARVIITSSSDEKLARAKALGADEGVNYAARPDWDKAVLELTGGAGVDHVVEVGGVGTLGRSYQVVGFQGKIALIGLLTREPGELGPHALMWKAASLHGVFVGNRVMFEQLNRAIETSRIKPVIDKVFPFERAADAFAYQGSGSHFGKIVISV